MIYLIKGILIGLIFGVPAGAVGAMCVQRTLQSGIKSGIITGLGSSVADCFYAVVGAFGITIISDFLTQFQTPINIAGGLLILAMGISTLLKKQSVTTVSESKFGYGKMFLTSFSVGITNPAAVLTFLFAFSYFGINGKLGAADGSALVAGVFCGTLIWWLTLSTIAQKIKDRQGEKGFARLNKIFGLIMIGFGILVFARLIFGG